MPAGHSVPIFILPCSRHFGKWWNRRPVKPGDWLIVISSHNSLVLAAQPPCAFPQSCCALSSRLHHLVRWCVLLCCHLMLILRTHESQIRGQRLVTHSQVLSLRDEDECFSAALGGDTSAATVTGGTGLGRDSLIVIALSASVCHQYSINTTSVQLELMGFFNHLRHT